MTDPLFATTLRRRDYSQSNCLLCEQGRYQPSAFRPQEDLDCDYCGHGVDRWMTKAEFADLVLETHDLLDASDEMDIE